MRKERSKAHPIRKAGTVIGTVLCVMLSFLLICNLTIIVKGTISPDRPPSMFSIYPMAVLSGSMSGDSPGHIEVGDLIFAKSAKPSDIKVNDVISFMEEKTVVTHRVMKIQTNDDGTLSFITKGDANNSEDSFPVHEDMLLGKYIARLPGVGNFAIFMQQPLGMMIFVGIPLLGFIIYDIIRRQKRASEEDKETADMKAEIERLRKLAGEDANSKKDEK